MNILTNKWTYYNEFDRKIAEWLTPSTIAVNERSNAAMEERKAQAIATGNRFYKAKQARRMDRLWKKARNIKRREEELREIVKNFN
jgi:hypothetical protein